MKRHLQAAVALGCLSSFPPAWGQSAAVAVCERQMTVAAQKYHVPLQVLFAVGMTETGNKGSMQPYAMNVDGKAHLARDLPDALHQFDGFVSQGAKFIDIGCMQVNHRFHGAKFRSVAAMFDPALNVDYAARLLSDLKVQHRTWTLAVARYNAGPANIPAQKRYVCAVIANMVATGFGSWTPGARSFCQ